MFGVSLYVSIGNFIQLLAVDVVIGDLLRFDGPGERQDPLSQLVAVGQPGSRESQQNKRRTCSC